MTQVYGGDDVNAIVLDPGSAYTRVGWAGDDAPRLNLASYYSSRTVDPEVMGDSSASSYQFGDDLINMARKNVDIGNPYENGLIEDWVAGNQLWSHALASELAASKDVPLMVTAPTWASEEYHKKVMEFCLETQGVPAAYIAKSPVCSMFSTGKGTALVVDAGAQSVSVTPVVDGLALYKPARRSNKAGNFLTARVKAALAAAEVDLTPRYQINTKTFSKIEPTYTKKSVLEGISESYHNFQVDQMLDDFKETIVQIAPSSVSLSDPSNALFTPREYEFPTGWARSWDKERFDLGEELFNYDTNESGSDEVSEVKREAEPEADSNESNSPAASSPAAKASDKELEYEQRDEANAAANSNSTGVNASSSTSATQDSKKSKAKIGGLSQLIVDCVNACDPDIRANLVGSIVITGGTSLLQGFTSRINSDLESAFPGFKVKIFAPGNIIERRNAAWLGGSILGSLGTFHQLWVSKQEWDEEGTALIAKRFR